MQVARSSATTRPWRAQPIRLICTALSLWISRSSARAERRACSSSSPAVFREGSDIELVNATADSYFDFQLWVNQRYTRHVDALPAGETIRLSLWDFFDELGENFSAGGFWRTEEPTAVRLVEIQLGSDQPMIGLITIQPTQAR